jgi:23S rRNA pseudouridine2605 synthase
MTTVRLQKVIAQAGLASRRAAEKMILDGRVMVNGDIITSLGIKVDPERDQIAVDRQTLRVANAKEYLIFYKPRKCVTTLHDPQGRRSIVDFLAKVDARLFPVGRLDYDAEGLLILTNDGELAHRLQHPRYGVHKVYDVKVAGIPDDAALNRLRSGVELEEGVTAPARVELLRTLPRACWLRVVLTQGWNHQLKRMCAAVGHAVLKIKRVAYGPLTLGQLQPGTHRPLTGRELRLLIRAVAQDHQDKSLKDKFLAV